MLLGSLPFSIGNLTKLISLVLDNNHLVGPVPSSLGNLTQLIILSLANNLLTGMLPNSMFNIPTLSEVLDLSYNFLSGTIPKEVGNLKNIAFLYISVNKFFGELPEELGTCQILTELDLSNNSFQGIIPSFLSKLQGLEVSNLSHNYFSGVIPEELGLLIELQELYLGGNNLSGDIPLALENLTNLWVLDISNNNFEGPVPTKGVFNNRTALMLAGNNRLCGGIPELNLPKCFIQQGRKYSTMLIKLVIRIVSTIVFSALLLLAFVVLKCKRNLTRESIINSMFEDWLPRVPYVELARQTENFAPFNLIGAGKYGCVYKGILKFKEESANQDFHTVAVKVFDLQQLGSSKSFLDECKALRIVKHRNLIRIRTCCSTIDNKGNDFKALVFDYVPNGNLQRWLHPQTDEHKPSNPLNLTQRLNIAIDIADALDYLHHNCQPFVIHCDLKPSNILLSEV